MSLFSDDASVISDPFLRRAYTLAAEGRGSVSPNPMVGCVIVRDGIVVGEGYHERAGGPHAEAVALAAAGDAARGATVYVTLEPCNHFGKTPPCAPALVRAGVSRVMVGMADPNEAVSGGGAQALAEAGVEVAFAPDDGPFKRLNEAWLHRLATGRPWVRVKLALTLDGRPALYASKRSRITGIGGAAITRELRSRATAVAVGAATAKVDNPRLTVRDEGDRAAMRQPVRVVLGRTSVPSPSARLFEPVSGSPVVVVVGDAAERKAIVAVEHAGAAVVTYRYTEGIRGALTALAGYGIDDVLVEAGPTLATALWGERLIDELVIVHAGGMGGNAAPPLFMGSPDAASGDLVAWMKATESAVRGDDAITVWRSRAGSGAAATGRSS